MIPSVTGVVLSHREDARRSLSHFRWIISIAVVLQLSLSLTDYFVPVASFCIGKIKFLSCTSILWGGKVHILTDRSLMCNERFLDFATETPPHFFFVQSGNCFLGWRKNTFQKMVHTLNVLSGVWCWQNIYLKKMFCRPAL